MIQIMVKNNINIFISMHQAVNDNINLNGSVEVLSHNIQACLQKIVYIYVPELMLMINETHKAILVIALCTC